MTSVPERDLLVMADAVPWVPQGSAGVWFKPLRISLDTGTWTNVLRVSENGVVNTHRHLAEVEGYVLSGAWHYEEHDWQATPGSFVYEPAGDVHTLVADLAPGEEMMTLFTIHGPIEYLDADGNLRYVETAQTKLERYLDYCAASATTPVDLDF
jgi:2,4'-dihydroxyacetophenone dioxygenase